ncbi:hypothetical protein Pcinc_007110 [Petrolisthes cinctipes]|uniref:Uncharacterized protein n=1 Tax=Petrolisthes cinctipes TaxID=88211 RepID=A0AAE1GBS0_PETCI|nr:hypothetical protein Pcinc_007110 [Petrolisthes cinctipes]
MKVSVTENKNWGRIHRFDETYEFEKQPTECSTNIKVYPAVIMYISCSSRTSACRIQLSRSLKKPSLSTRYLWDPLRVLTKAKPKQILSATNRQGDLHVDSEDVTQGNIYSLKRVQNRLRFRHDNLRR